MVSHHNSRTLTKTLKVLLILQINTPNFQKEGNAINVIFEKLCGLFRELQIRMNFLTLYAFIILCVRTGTDYACKALRSRFKIYKLKKIR